MTSGQLIEVGSTYILEMTGDDPKLGLGLLRPELLLLLVGNSSKPAERWNRDNLFTTLEEVWVRTPI